MCTAITLQSIQGENFFGRTMDFFDGVNEQGFAAAVLYFEGYANYDLPIEGKEPIASLDFLHYILGRCEFIPPCFFVKLLL